MVLGSLEMKILKIDSQVIYVRKSIKINSGASSFRLSELDWVQATGY